MHEVTCILCAMEQGDPRAAEQLLPLVYKELRRLAVEKMAQEKPGQTLQATALVHEAYIRLVDVEKAQHWNSRGHFFSAAAEAMRRIIVESVRRKGRLKRGGDQRRHDVLTIHSVDDGPDIDVLAVDEALTKMALQHPPKAQLVKLRYFAGLTMAEAASIMEISTVTAERYWRYARAWLASELRGGPPSERE
jgi:RNA polymerase sigma factor (TIGR02999 family)